MKELFELHQERIRADDHQDKNYIVPDEKKKIARVTKFIKEFHDMIVTVDWRQILKVYQSVINIKEDTITKLTKDLGLLGLIDKSTMPKRNEESTIVDVA